MKKLVTFFSFFLIFIASAKAESPIQLNAGKYLSPNTRVCQLSIAMMDEDTIYITYSSFPRHRSYRDISCANDGRTITFVRKNYTNSFYVPNENYYPLMVLNSGAIVLDVGSNVQSLYLNGTTTQTTSESSIDGTYRSSNSACELIVVANQSDQNNIVIAYRDLFDGDLNYRCSSYHAGRTFGYKKTSKGDYNGGAGSARLSKDAIFLDEQIIGQIVFLRSKI